jgi:hypothetical protein
MTIRDTREEILRLIERLNGNRHDGGRRSERPARAVEHGTVKKRARRPEPSGSSERAVEARRQQLEQIIARREQMEEVLPVSRLLDRLGTLEERLAVVERDLGQNGGRAAAPATASSATNAMGDCTLGGSLKSGLLPDLLQLISSNQLSGTFFVTHGKVELRLYFSEGEIVHADGPGVVGESAVFAVMAVDTGTYKFVETTAPPDKRTIQSKTQLLILEGLRRVDEERAGAG